MNKKFHCGCELEYDVADESTFIFNVAVANTNNQRILSESLQLIPELSYQEYVEPNVNNRLFRVNVPAGRFQLIYEAQVALNYLEEDPGEITEIPPSAIPLDVIHYLYPSRYCESDRLYHLTQAQFADLAPGYSRVTALCDWIYDNVIYLAGSSNTQTSAFNTVTERTGVCRDFAHLGIAFCRALNIPARFASGYAYQLVPPDFHAYFEAYLGNRWYVFDATRLVPLDGLIRIGTGKDAAESAFATIFGPVEMTDMRLFVNSLD